ncbi:MAG: hypothetical protein Q8R69_07770 [Telluria sp.]|nr:hypothetical protein [Telluria sp.]
MSIFDFASFRRSLAGLGEQLKKMQSEIEELRRKREALLSTPANKADVKEMLSGWVRDAGEEYRKSLHTTLAMFIRNPRAMTPALLAKTMSVTGAAQPLGDGLRPQDVDQALCALFAPLLKTALMEQVDLMDWQNQGLPMKERAIEAEKLESRIFELEKTYAELVNQADEAGIDWRNHA